MAIAETAEAAAPALPKPRLRGMLHLIAFPISIVTGAVLVFGVADNTRDRIGCAIYALACMELFGVSALYHRGDWGPEAHARLRRLDHANIFVQIAGTYTPLCLALLDGNTRVIVLSAVWVGALAGIIFRCVWMSAPPWVYTPVYLALGWVAIAVLPQLWREGGPAIVLLVIAGGVAYSLGAVAYARRRPDPIPHVFGYHEVFHLGTIVGYATHCLAVGLAVS
jgi:hemolysin III